MASISASLTSPSPFEESVFIDANTLVISHKGKTGGDMTFALNPATHLQGSVVVGASVDVRYREDGKTYVATAVTAQPSKPQATHTAAPKP